MSLPEDINGKLIMMFRVMVSHQLELGYIKQELGDVKEELGDARQELGHVRQELDDIRQSQQDQHIQMTSLIQRLQIDSLNLVIQKQQEHAQQLGNIHSILLQQNNTLPSPPATSSSSMEQDTIIPRPSHLNKGGKTVPSVITREIILTTIKNHFLPHIITPISTKTIMHKRGREKRLKTSHQDDDDDSIRSLVVYDKLLQITGNQVDHSMATTTITTPSVILYHQLPEKIRSDLHQSVNQKVKDDLGIRLNKADWITMFLLTQRLKSKMTTIKKYQKKQEQ